MALTDAYVVPELPEYSYETGWTKDLFYYSYSLEGAAKNRYRDAAEARAHYIVQDLYRHAYELVHSARDDKDAEMLLVYADWMFKTDFMGAVRDTVQVLRKHHEGEVRHLVTLDRIYACRTINEAIINRGGTDWDNNRECAYLAFSDPSLTPKIVALAERGIYRVEDIKECIPGLKGVEVSLSSGVL